MQDKEASPTLSDELAHIKHIWWLLPDWAMLVGFLIAAGSFFYVVSFAGRLGSMVATVYFATQVAYRLGVYYGFACGFQQGREADSVMGNSLKNRTALDASSEA